MILALCLGMYGTSQAQNGWEGRNMTPEDRATKQAQRMTETLQLNADQKQKVYDLSLETAKQMQELRSSGDHDAMKDVKEKNDTKMKGILTADQYTKYQEMRAERMQKMQERQQQSGD